MSLLKWPVLLSVVALGMVIGVAGCTTNSSKAVLAGDWVLTETNNPNPLLTQVLLTFDSNGNLTTVTYTFNNATVTSTGAELNSTTAVSGSDVTITSTFGGSGQNTLDFTGTLNTDNTVITGNANFTIVISNTVTVTFPLGSATLTKQ